jgi:hypothetical protein
MSRIPFERLPAEVRQAVAARTGAVRGAHRTAPHRPESTSNGRSSGVLRRTRHRAPRTVSAATSWRSAAPAQLAAFGAATASLWREIAEQDGTSWKRAMAEQAATLARALSADPSLRSTSSAAPVRARNPV